MKWYFKVLKQYTDFSGRARREEFWMFYLFHFIFNLALNFLDIALGMEDFGIGTIYSLAILLPYLAVSVRRMHDLGKSGWYILIPIYNLVLLCTNGEEGPNEYGPDPKNPNTELDDIGVAEA